jgi:thiol:disulfide interchange protein DsbD
MGAGATVVRRAVGALAAIYGVMLLAGALSGATDPLQPLARFTSPGVAKTGNAADAAHKTPFTRIKSTADFDAAIAAAQAEGKTVMLDFYADWCVSCKEMEKYTFPAPAVQAALANTVKLQADVTANDEVDQALMQRFGILGPPSILFFGTDGVEKPDYRVVGFKPAEDFAPHIQQAFGGPST